MATVRRVWTQDSSFDEKKYLDTVTIYDGGDFLGLLLQTTAGKQWSGFSILERKSLSSTSYEELIRPAHDFFVPLGFFSIETYPALLQGSILWLPGWKVQSFPLNGQPGVGSPSQPQKHQHQQPLQQEQKQNQNQNQQMHPKRRQPGPPPSPVHLSPSSQSPQKVPSVTPILLQRPSQSKNRTLAKQKVLSSADLISHERLKLSDQEKRAASPLPPSPIDHIVQQSQWHPLSQLSLSPHLHEAPEESTLPQASSFHPQTNSQQHLPSRQVRPQYANKSPRPTSSKKLSHEQIAQVPGTAFY